jgi:two-component system, OmpR family, phosphate regulon response regulator OmpR
MPGVDGLAALRALRNAGDNTPVIMLTARAEGVDRVIGLELGADDYIGKPFMPQELMARISAVLRRHSAVAAPSGERPESYRFGRFELDLATRTLTRDGVPQRVTPSETGLLSVLIAHPMETLSRSRLLSLWHGAYVDVTERGLDVPIWRLRRLIEENPSQPRIIQTMRGIGYMFVPPQDSDA